MKSKENTTIGNIYRLNGRVPLLKAIPFGLQHVLAMFVSNLTPITMIGLASGLSGKVGDFTAECHVCCGYCHIDPAVPGLESRCKTSYRYGSKFYLCNNLKLCGRHLWIPDNDRSSISRRCL